MEKAAGRQGQQAIEKVRHRSEYRNEYPVPDKGGVVGPHQGDQNGGGQGDLHEQIAQQLGGKKKSSHQMSEPKSTDVKDTWIMWMTECYMQMVLSRITLSSGKN